MPPPEDGQETAEGRVEKEDTQETDRGDRQTGNKATGKRATANRKTQNVSPLHCLTTRRNMPLQNHRRDTNSTNDN